jgi:hypothetical protein
MRHGHGIVFCVDCPRPENEGSFVDTWDGFANERDYHAVGEVVYAVPNDGSEPLLNTVAGAIVMIDRGTVPLVQKVRYAQQAGAEAVVIVDTSGECNEVFDCGGWLGSRSNGAGMASNDGEDVWSDIHIPAVMVTAQGGQRLRSGMDLVEMEVSGHGTQFFVEEI